MSPFVTYKSLNALTPQYLSDFIPPYKQFWVPQSSAVGLLSVPCSQPPYLYGIPTLWNSLPSEIHSTPSLASFKKLTFLKSIQLLVFVLIYIYIFLIYTPL